MQFCPNCGDKDIEKTAENEVYCSKCDVTFISDKGKKARPQPTNRIVQIEEGLKQVVTKIKGIEETLKPKPEKSDDNFFGLETKESE